MKKKFALLVFLVLFSIQCSAPVLLSSPQRTPDAVTPTSSLDPLTPTSPVNPAEQAYLDSRAHYETAFDYYIEEKFAQAAEEFWTTVQIDPSFAYAYRWMAQAYLDMEDPETALQHFNELLQKDPNNALAYYAIGKIYSNTDRYNQALEYARKSIELDPHLSLGYNLLGTIFTTQGKLEEANLAYRKALEVQPGFTIAITPYLAYFEEETAEQTVAKCQKLLAADPNDPLADVYQFIIFRDDARLAKNELVIQEGESFLISYPQSIFAPDVMVLLIQAYMNVGALDQAALTAEQTLQKYPNSETTILASFFKIIVETLQATNLAKTEKDLEELLKRYPYFNESNMGVNKNVAGHNAIENILKAYKDGSIVNELVFKKADKLLAAGNYDEAIGLFEQTLQNARQKKNKDFEVYALLALSYAYNELGQTQQELYYRQQIDNLSDSVSEEMFNLHVVKNKCYIGQIYIIYLGLVNNGIPYAQQCLDLAFQAKLPQDRDSAYGILGVAYRLNGEYQKSIDTLLKGLESTSTFEDEKGLSDQVIIFKNIAAVYQTDLQDYNHAVEYYGKCVQSSKRLKDNDILVACLSDLTQAYIDQENPDQALKTVQEILQIADNELASNPDRAVAYTAAAIVAEEIGNDLHKAANYGQMALDAAISSGNKNDIADKIDDLLKIYQKLGDESAVKSLIDQQLKTLQDWEGGYTLSQVKMALLDKNVDRYSTVINALTWLADRQFTNRKQILAQAYNTVEAARARAFLDQLNNQKIDGKDPAGQQLVEQQMLLKGTIRALNQQVTDEQSKPVDEIDPERLNSLQGNLKQKQLEYENLLTNIKMQDPEFGALITANSLTLPEIQALLDPQTTLVEYYILEDHTLAFLLTRDNFAVVKLKVTAADLNQEVSTFRAFALLDDAQPLELKKLYSQLIAPIKPYLLTPKIALVPHGILHYLSFAALTDGKTYLGETYSFYTLPSASTLPYIQTKIKTEGSPLLALGNPATGLPLANLKYAENEVQAIAKIFNAQPLVSSQASETALKGGAGQSGILHLAAHAEYSPANPLFSAILLAPDQENDGRLEVHEIYALQLSQKTELVVLSACQTQIGPLHAAGEIIGMNRAFLYAGSPSVVASLWQVDDEATSLLMERFYRYLKAGQDKAGALRQAQMDVKQKYPHPYYWAGFVLTGDPGRIHSIPLTLEPVILGIGILVVVLPGAGLITLWLVRRRAKPGRKKQQKRMGELILQRSEVLSHTDSPEKEAALLTLSHELRELGRRSSGR